MNNKFLTISSPLDQFEIRDYIIIDAPILANIHISLTNITLYLFISLIIIISLLGITNKFPKFINKNWILFKECIYDTVNNVVVNQIEKNKGQLYFPFIFSLFIFILINNLIGLIPYSFSTTSHFILAFSWSFSIVIGTVILGISIHRLKFLGLFVPAGCPLPMLPFLVLIETISFLARNISLGLRLAANILAGHMLLFILSGFTFKIFKAGILGILGILPLTFIIAFSFLEFGIAFIQAQVFIVLSAGYIKDSIFLH
jgi:F-type H+-transporting ATPase subunit a